MTTEDIKAALELASEDSSFMNNAAKTHHSLQTKVAGTEKSRRIEINAVLFLQTMLDKGGTFVWSDGPKSGHKFATVFDALAAEMPIFANLGLMDRAQHIEENAPRLRGGFYATRKWLAQWYMDTVFVVPQHNESSVPTVITLDPHFVLECGKTAAQMQAERDFKLADGQIRASTKRLAASTKQKDTIKTRLNEIMQKAMVELDDLRPERD